MKFVNTVKYICVLYEFL